MWLFNNKKELSQAQLFENYIEYHCHLLPGVDDGVKKTEDTLYILSQYEKLGVSEIWLTPHIMEDMPNTTEDLRMRLQILQSIYSGQIKLHLAAEYMMDNLFDERLSKSDLLPLGIGQNHLLVETSYFNPPMDLYGTIERIKTSGYYPMLAHPERYNYMDDSDYDKLRDMGVKFQLNLPSFVGFYGEHVQKKAQKLFKLGYYDILGMDVHNIRMFEHIMRGKIGSPFIGKIKINNI